MLGSKAPWVEPAIGPEDQQFDELPEEASPRGTSAWVWSVKSHERGLARAEQIPEHEAARRLQRGAP